MSGSVGFVFPEDPFSARIPDEAFTRDFKVARDVGLDVNVVRFDDYGLTSFGGFPDLNCGLVYRGWMLSPGEYKSMVDVAAVQGFPFVTSSAQYVAAHHLPGWVTVFEGLTPRSVIVPEDADALNVVAAGAELGCSRFVVKDFVKSRKYEWESAVFASSLGKLPGVVAEFVRLQEGFLVGGVVIREFVRLDEGVPEVRVWWVYGVPVLVSAHPDFGGVRVDVGLVDAFLPVVGERVDRLGCPFVTTDLARTVDGGWIVVEVGDGQVSGFAGSVTDDEMGQVFSAL